MAETDEVITKTSLEALPKIAEGKVRDLYEVDSTTLLFVATDRISAFDVIMGNVSGPVSILLFIMADSFRVFHPKADCLHSCLPTGSISCQPSFLAFEPTS